MGVRWQRLSDKASFIWGDDWMRHFLAVTGLTARTLARWEWSDWVPNGQVLAMLDAFAKLKRAGMVAPNAEMPVVDATLD